MRCISDGRAIATFVDEIGIEIGILGEHRLKAAYQPIFARDGDCLRAVAAYGSAVAFLFGQAVDRPALMNTVLPRDRLIVGALGAALCLRNLHHAGVPALQLVVSVDPGGGSVARVRAAARALAGEIARCGLASGDVAVELATSPDPDHSILAAGFDALRDQGIRIAVVEQGDGPACGLLQEPLPPDLVRIDGGWFSTIARQAATARLFKALVRACHSRGARILVDGIETVRELRVAVDSGADLLCGNLLAPPALAGAVFPERATADRRLPLRGARRPLVPLIAGHRRNHHRR